MSERERREAIVFLSHVLDEEVLSRFEELKRDTLPERDVYFAYDGSGTSRSHRRSARQHLGETLRIFSPSKILDVPYPNRYAHQETPGLIPGNTDLLYLHFSELEPSYSHYWFIEYDVAYTGPWSDLFAAFASSDADLLGTTLSPYQQQPDWYWWPSFEPTVNIDRTDWVRGFFPVIRLSMDAIDLLDNGYRAGWAGHFEVVIPTLLHYHGRDIEDIGGDGPFVAPDNRNRFYTTDTFRYRPVRHQPGQCPDTLWHPIKPE